MQINSQSAKPWLALLVMTLMWGWGWTVLKIGLLDAEPFKFTAARMSVSALCLLMVLPATGRSMRPQRVPELLLLALVQTSVLFALSTWAIDEGTVGRIAFLVYTMPFFTLLFAWVLLGEVIKGKQWIAVALAGLGLIALIQPWQLGDTMLGNTLALGAGATWAMGAVIVKRIQKRAPMDLISMTAWQMFFGTIPLLILAWWVPEPAIVWSPRFIIVLAIISIGMTGVGWLLWVYALDNLSAGTASLATLAAPVIAVISAAYYFGEHPSAMEIIGMFLIAFALMVLSIDAIAGHVAEPPVGPND
ncbi:MAG: EamA family transporter [Pseudomonadota bacterium]